MPQEATKQRWTRSPPVWATEQDPMNQNDKNGTGIGTSSRRRFDEQYKRHAVELTLHGDRSVKAVARELELPAWQLYEWRKLYAPRPGGGGPDPQTLAEAIKEVERLRSELIRMRERETTLKKSLGILSEPPERGMPRLKR